MGTGAQPLVLHANAVAVDGRGLLIRGRSGSGKSTMALELMARGAVLVADDRVLIDPREDGSLWMSAPPTIAGLIEARGIGILNAEILDCAPVAAILDLDETEAHRLPPVRKTLLINRSIPVLHNCATPGFAAAVLQYLRGGRKD
ncbi:HPr kinase/phosphorylase [Tropicibacter sp. S64]|uniref:HPr kinase/phosphorylase n=1 Tax=Tropicibacter sp. S64 TaxID=3415122 RepID=UPI003C7D5957